MEKGGRRQGWRKGEGDRDREGRWRQGQRMGETDRDSIGWREGDWNGKKGGKSLVQRSIALGRKHLTL